MATICIFCVVMATATLALGDVTLRFNIREERKIGTTIVSLKNERQITDRFSNAQVRQLSFKYLDPAQIQRIARYFDLEEWTGILTFAEVLDRDDPDICRQLEDCLITLDIAINPTEFFDVIHVEINLLDDNDNAPEFPEDRITTSITELTSRGLLFPIVAATDSDSPANGISEYRLVAPDQFHLEQTRHDDGTVDLRLMLTSLLDRENKDRFTLKVIAIDGGIPDRTGSVVIDLIINDVNDNSPEFDKTIYQATVWENKALSRPIVTVHATDHDSGANGMVFYSFSKLSAAQFGSMFTLGSESGEIRLVQDLDYEHKQMISLTVVAQDQGTGSRPAYTTVQITVVDVNDHRPAIKLETSDPDAGDIIAITEHSPSETFVVHVSVTDLDAEDAGKVDCTIDDELHFHLQKHYEKEYNIITMMDLDREVASQYNLRLECFDYGEPSLTTTVTIEILVDDINDHSPVFDQSEYTVTLDENTGHHASVVRVHAQDSDDRNNGKIVYMLDENAGNDFHIDPSTGLITTMVSLDHEKVAFRQFHVIAMDHAREPKYGRTLISLTIHDIDDEPPRFEQKKYIFTVPEGLPPRTEVNKVKAVDSDGPPYNNFTYFLDGSDNDLSYFEIDRNTGMIFTKKALDRESREVYHIMAIAQSDTIPRKSDTAQVDIHVKDKNDNQPLISFPKYGNESIYLSNAVPIGHVVGRVEATDPDFGDNSELSYTISQGSGNGEFVIEPDSGDILVNKRLDEFDNAVFKLVIMVQDGGKPRKISVQTLNIVVTKMNITWGETGSGLGNGGSITTSATHIPIIIGVVAGCLLISLILIIAIVMMKRRHRKQPSGKSHQYWSENGMTEKGKDTDNVPMTTTPGGNKLAMADISLTVKSDILKQPQLENGKDDSDSGCADVSHTESQGSGEELPEGSLRKHGSGSSTGSFSRCPPQRMESFSTWLHSENYNLTQKGNVYRVSEQNRERSGGSPSSTLTNKKTVRFTEPQRKPAIPNNYSEQPGLPPAIPNNYSEQPGLPPPPLEFTHLPGSEFAEIPGIGYSHMPESEFSHAPVSEFNHVPESQFNHAPGSEFTQVPGSEFTEIPSYYGQDDGYYGNHADGLCYDNDGAIVVVPDKSAFTTFQSNDGSLV